MSTADSEGAVEHPGLPVPLVLRCHARARVLRLRFDGESGLVRLTCPPGISRRAALQWAGEQRAWVEAQLAARLPALPFGHGVMIPFNGGGLSLDWRPGAARTIRRENDVLIGGGPGDGFSRRVEAWLRGEALGILSAETARIAGAAGIHVASVSIGDPATRWGSCSFRGAIRYSWRLILAPPEARRFVVAHEVAHRLHMNHGREFRQAEALLFGGDVRRARALLRRLGPSLRRVGRKG